LQKEDSFVDDAIFSKGNTSIIGSNLVSAKAVKSQADREGFNAQIITTSLQGEARKIGRELAQRLRSEKSASPFCLIFGGETTVTLNNARGQGGRNQELALSAVRELAGAENLMLITLATDGEDGPTDAAGAVVTGETLARAEKLGLSVDAHLEEHNAYLFFDALGDLIKIGSTGTNVNDLCLLFAF
jgi:hydroxypyruvate reductase